MSNKDDFKESSYESDGEFNIKKYAIMFGISIAILIVIMILALIIM